MREALGLLFDFEWSNRTLFNGAYSRAASYYPNSEFAARDIPQGEEWLLLSTAVPQAVAGRAVHRGAADAQDRRTRHPARNTCVAPSTCSPQAGWKSAAAGLVNGRGQPLSFEILLVNPSLERILQPYRDNLARLGIRASLRTVDRAQYKQRIDGFDYDMILMTLPQTLSPGLEQWQYFHSSQLAVRGSRNYAGVNHPVVDALLDRLLAAQSREQQVAAARALDRVLLSPALTASPTGTATTTVWPGATASPTSPRRPTPSVCGPGGSDPAETPR